MAIFALLIRTARHFQPANFTMGAACGLAPFCPYWNRKKFHNRKKFLTIDIPLIKIDRGDQPLNDAGWKYLRGGCTPATILPAAVVPRQHEPQSGLLQQDWLIQGSLPANQQSFSITNFSFKSTTHSVRFRNWKAL